MGGDVTRVGQAGSPGSDGASPYPSFALPEPKAGLTNITLCLRVLYLISDHIPEERRLVEEHRSLARTEHRMEAS